LERTEPGGAPTARARHALGRFEVAEPLYERAPGALRELGDSNAQGFFSMYLGLLHDAVE
jgi:hypothetical protein